jgi:hypothetical protein|tara:strand:- start:39 stop:485 length:447 start_codon:yes stop_codon:yes gene_type:complete
MADYEAQLKKLLSNKKSMGGDKYSAAIGKLKKDMKANNAGSFKKLLNSVKKQEREGKFDRGAEGKAKNKLRAKMAKEPQTQLTKGVHAGSRTSESLEKGYTQKGVEYRGPETSEESVDVSKALSGETDKQREERKKAKKRKVTPGHSR